jgi:hypothetical protein
MTTTPAARPNGRHPDPHMGVTLRKLTDPPITTTPAGTYTPKGVPRKEIASSLLGRGPIPLAWLFMVLALVAEQWRIGVMRAASTFSNLEALVISKGMAGATKIRDRGAEQLTIVVEQYQRTLADIARMRADLDRLDEQPVTGINGDIIQAREASERMKTVSARVTEERDTGSLKHRRVPLWLHRFSTWVALADFPVLLYFLAQVFNVDLAGLSSGSGAAWSESLVPLITAIVFALLGTAAVAIGLKFFGRDLKGYKDTHGSIALPEDAARMLPLLFAGLATMMAIGAGIVMAYRIVTDSLAAGGGITGAVVLGVFFAVIVIVVNVVVFAARFRDGSLQTDEISHLAAKLDAIERRRVELHREIGRLTPELDILRTKGDQVYAATVAKMGDATKGADQVRLLARSYHQGCGANAELTDQQDKPLRGLLLPDVTVDTSLLDRLLKQMTPDNEGTDENSTPVGVAPTDTPTNTALVQTTPADEADDADDLGGEW